MDFMKEVSDTWDKYVFMLNHSCSLNVSHTGFYGSTSLILPDKFLLAKITNYNVILLWSGSVFFQKLLTNL